MAGVEGFCGLVAEEELPLIGDEFSKSAMEAKSKEQLVKMETMRNCLTKYLGFLKSRKHFFFFFLLLKADALF